MGASSNKSLRSSILGLQDREVDIYDVRRGMRQRLRPHMFEILRVKSSVSASASLLFSPIEEVGIWDQAEERDAPALEGLVTERAHHLQLLRFNLVQNDATNTHTVRKAELHEYVGRGTS